jgi:hypothetical protein
MVAGRHNLTRRALLGVGVGACVASDSRLLTVPPAAAALPAPTDPAGRDSRQATVPWDRTLAAYRRAEARVAAFKAEDALLPAARRTWPACRDLEERFGQLDSGRLAALRGLLRTPAPDLPALALKLDLAVTDQAWEITGCETCLEALATDARRLAGVAAGGGW